MELRVKLHELSDEQLETLTDTLRLLGIPFNPGYLTEEQLDIIQEVVKGKDEVILRELILNEYHKSGRRLDVVVEWVVSTYNFLEDEVAREYVRKAYLEFKDYRVVCEGHEGFFVTAKNLKGAPDVMIFSINGDRIGLHLPTVEHFVI